MGNKQTGGFVFLRKIANNLRIESGDSGGALRFDLDPHAGGHTTKVALYQVVIVQKSSTNARISVDLDHGPDGRTFVPHSTAIGTTQLSGSNEKMVSGQADTAKVIGEWLAVSLVASGASSAKEWMTVDVYEMLKPF